MTGPLLLRPWSGLGEEIGGKGKDKGNRSLNRRWKRDPSFPPVVWLNGRKYLVSDAWENYKLNLMREGLQKPPASPPARKDTAQPTPSRIEHKFNEIIEPTLDTS
jgi:hypothetical protein